MSRESLSRPADIRWWPGLTTGLSLLACYGTQVAIAALGLAGVSVGLNESVWAGAILFFAGLAVVALGAGWWRHRRLWPVALGAGGAVVLGHAMLVHYTTMGELAGFVLLLITVVADWRLRGSAAARG